MKNLKLILIALITISFVSCNSQKKEDKQGEIIELISITELEKVDNSVQLIDVRTPKEYEQGYIKHAENINYKDDNFIEQTEKLDKNKPVYVYCMAGVRSGYAAELLKEAGFTKIFDYKGGYGEWKSEGNEISN